MITERIPTIWDQPLPRAKRTEEKKRSANTRLPKAGA